MLEQHTYLVSELGHAIAGALDNEFGDLWVSGTISGLKRHSNGNVYFDLVEPADEVGRPPLGQLSLVLLKSKKPLINKLLKRSNVGRMADGMQVRIRGGADFYAPSGRLSVRMTSIDPTFTLGKMVDQREQVLALLNAEGLLDRNRLCSFPVVALRVGLVTSKGSAAYHDFVTELERSGLAFAVTLIDTVVQGPDAPQRISAAIATLASKQDLDVIAIIRGGGSRGDLATFDSEQIARAIALAATPVVTGIGHEIDTSIADAVAHTSFKTPTACANGLVEQTRLFENDLYRIWTHIRQRSSHLLELAGAALTQRSQHVASHTRRTLEVDSQKLASADQRIRRASINATSQASNQLRRRELQLRREAPRSLEWAERQLSTLAVRVSAYDPARALARGWSITTTLDGTVVRSIDSLDDGAGLVTTVADGHIISTTTTTSASPYAVTIEAETHE